MRNQEEAPYIVIERDKGGGVGAFVLGALVGAGIALLLAVGALAYRPLFWSVFELPLGSQLEGWLFRPSQLPAPLVIALASWLLFRRRRQLLVLPARSAPLAAALCVALGGSLFIWAQLTRTADFLLPALSAQLLAFAAGARADWRGALPSGRPHPLAQCFCNGRARARLSQCRGLVPDPAARSFGRIGACGGSWGDRAG